MRAYRIHLAVAFGIGLAACQAPPPGAAPSRAKNLGGSDGSVQFENVPGDDTDPFQAPSTPPAVAMHMHSCQKIPYQTIGALLTSRGVDLNAVAKTGAPPTAGQIYKDQIGAAALGAPNYAARVREPTQATTSGATKLHDLFLMAAPEIIAAMPKVKACQVFGTPARMFDDDGQCTPEGILCLTGGPVGPGYVDLCNQLLEDLKTKKVATATARQIAVAAILSAAHTCE